MKIHNKGIFKQSSTVAWEKNSATGYYKKGHVEDNPGIQVTPGSPLQWDIITTTDSLITHKKFNVILRFTHSEASSLATLMGIPEESKDSHSLLSFSNNRKALKIIPLRAIIP